MFFSRMKNQEMCFRALGGTVALTSIHVHLRGSFLYDFFVLFCLI